MGHHPMGEGVDPNPRFLAERLVDPSALIMGNTAENLHDRFPHLTKERADAFAVGSQEKLAKAYADGKIQRRPGPDRRPVRRPSGLGPRHRRRAAAPGHHAGGPRRPQDAVPPARPRHRGQRRRASTTAPPAASSPPRRWPRSSASRPRCAWSATASPASSPRSWASARCPSTEKALARTGLTIDDIGLFELNEAFAVQVLAFLDHFGIADDDPRVNPYGGAIAVGHPLASSGVRLMTQLARQFEEHPEVRYGLTAMCIGLGMGGTVLWENPHFDGKVDA